MLAQLQAGFGGTVAVAERTLLRDHSRRQLQHGLPWVVRVEALSQGVRAAACRHSRLPRSAQRLGRGLVLVQRQQRLI